MKGNPRGFVLGEYDVRAAEHGKGVVREMLGRDARDGEAHYITVAVWADGRLQFADADCRPHNGHGVTRAEARAVATVIAQRMGTKGDIATEPVMPPPPMNQKPVREVCASLREIARTQRLTLHPAQFPTIYGKPLDVFFNDLADEIELASRWELEEAVRSAKSCVVDRETRRRGGRRA